jgi:hypothetical protein
MLVKIFLPKLLQKFPALYLIIQILLFKHQSNLKMKLVSNRHVYISVSKVTDHVVLTAITTKANLGISFFLAGIWNPTGHLPKVYRGRSPQG